MSKIKFSEFQNNIFDFGKNEIGHGIINAVAGSGKTFTLIELMKIVQGKSFFGAFNKSIAEELGKKCPSNVDVSTLHSLGLKIIVKNHGKVKINNNKIDWIMNDIAALSIMKSMKAEEKAEVYKKRNLVKKMCSLIKGTLTDYNNIEKIFEIVNFYGIDNFDTSIMPLISRVFDKILDQKNIVDFDDMIYFPVAFKMKGFTYDNVFVDECQDLNLCQIELILSIVKRPNGRIFAVGDPKQSIYGFRGADASAMSRLKEVLNATELPLSVCYRCPKSHIELVQEIVPHILPKDNAIDGTIINLNEKNFEDEILKDVSFSPLVICRINAPLVGYALKLISKGIKAIVKGRDIGSNLITIIKNLKADSINDLYSKISEWENEEISKLQRRNSPVSTQDTVNDKAETIRIIADSCKSIDQLIETIENLFTDDNTTGVTFSTIHKAKGLENDNVYIIKHALLPLKRKNQQKWEFEQELNLQYVAYTRSKNKLVLVN